MWLIAIKNDGAALNQMPYRHKLKTPELCLQAIMGVPDDIKTLEICFEAFKKQRTNFIFSKIPKNFRKKIEKMMDDLDFEKRYDTEEKILDFIKENPNKLAEVPEKMRTQSVCLAAIKERESACEHIPKEIMSENFFYRCSKSQ